jgi:DNA polymerase-3 subunit epsilon
MGDYAALRERAARFLTATGGRAPLADLAAHLFGAPSPGPWVGLLRQVLGPDFIIDGAEVTLAVPGPRPDTPVSALTFTVLDIETTGLDPASCRPVQVSAIKVRPGGQPPAVFQTLVRPDRPVHRGIRRFSWAAELDRAPDLKAVLASLGEFIEGVAVGQDIRWQWEFLGIIARQLALTWPPRPVLDSAVLAHHLFPDLGKPSLERIAGRLGAPVLGRDRADRDAYMLASALPALLRAAESRGIRTWGQLEAVAGWPALAPVRLPDPSRLPEGPGVYILRDGLSRALYVGKSRNLRARVRSYFSRPPAYNRHLEGLPALTRSIEAIPCGTELSAVLTEGRLIADLAPPYNQARRIRGPAFVYRTNEPFSRWYAGWTVPPDAPFFAAFDSPQQARSALASARESRPLPGCRRRLPLRGRPACVLTRSGDPCRVCRGEVPAEAYPGIVAEAEAELARLAGSFGLILFGTSGLEAHLWLGGAYRGRLDGARLSAEGLIHLLGTAPDPLTTTLFWRWRRLNPDAGLVVPLSYPGASPQQLAAALRAAVQASD